MAGPPCQAPAVLPAGWAVRYGLYGGDEGSAVGRWGMNEGGAEGGLAPAGPCLDVRLSETTLHCPTSAGEEGLREVFEPALASMTVGLAPDPPGFVLSPACLPAASSCLLPAGLASSPGAAADPSDAPPSRRASTTPKTISRIRMIPRPILASLPMTALLSRKRIWIVCLCSLPPAGHAQFGAAGTGVSGDLSGRGANRPFSEHLQTLVPGKRLFHAAILQ